MKVREFLACLLFSLFVGSSPVLDSDACENVSCTKCLECCKEFCADAGNWKITALSLAEMASNTFGSAAVALYENKAGTRAVRSLYGWWGKCTGFLQNKWVTIFMNLFSVPSAVALFKPEHALILEGIGGIPSYLLAVQVVVDLVLWRTARCGLYSEERKSAVKQDLLNNNETEVAGWLDKINKGQF